MDPEIVDVDMESDVVEVEVVTESSADKAAKFGNSNSKNKGIEIDLGVDINSLVPIADSTTDKVKIKKKKGSGSRSGSIRSVSSKGSIKAAKSPAKSTVGSQNSQDSEQYNVERIVDKRYNRDMNRVEYLIKWEGYPMEDNTWEPLGNIYCRELVDAFELKRKEKAKQKFFPKRAEKKTELKTNTKKIRQMYYNESSSESEDESRRIATKKKKVAGSKMLNFGGDSKFSKSKNLTKESHLNVPKIPLLSSASKQEGSHKDIKEVKKIPLPLPPKRTEVDVNKFLTSRNYAINEASAVNGFDHGYELEDIVGLGRVSGGGRQFLIKWKGKEELELVPSAICNKRCPQKVIKFYERRTHWASDSEQSSFDEFCQPEH